MSTAKKLTPLEFAKKAGVVRRTVYKWLYEGTINGYVKGVKRLMISEAELKKVLPRRLEKEEYF